MPALFATFLLLSLALAGVVAFSSGTARGWLKWLLLLRKEINFPGVVWDEQSDNSAHAFRDLVGRDLNGEVFVCGFESHTPAA